MNKTKEFAKFFSGVAAMEVVVHLAFALSDLLPLTILGITLTKSLNTFAIIFWPIVLTLLVYYAWIRKEIPNSTGHSTKLAHP